MRRNYRRGELPPSRYLREKGVPRGSAIYMDVPFRKGWNNRKRDIMEKAVCLVERAFWGIPIGAGTCSEPSKNQVTVYLPNGVEIKIKLTYRVRRKETTNV